MSQKTINDAKGLYTDPNLLSKVPEGAVVVGDNVICDRDGMYEPRRGFGQYGLEFGVPDDRAKQLLSYKNRLLVHYDSTLMFNSVPHSSGIDGSFVAFDGTYEEVTPGLRIKGIESNRNLYFTTADGIKKISATTADELSSSPEFIIDAGGPKALDVTGSTSGSSFGFLPANSTVAYRVVWGYKDNNDNLILGAPSSRFVVRNYSDNSTNVDLQFVIPTSIEPDIHFYQVYRTGVFTGTAAIPLVDLDPGDEMNLVIEDFPTALEFSADLVEVEDITPDNFRVGGLPLYTNPNSGEGINQSNEPPPKSTDIALYQNSVFYANIETRARQTFDLLSVQNISDGDSFTVTSDLGLETYTFKGATEITDLDFSGYTGSIPGDLNGKRFHLNSASNARKYYVWYDTTTTTQNMNFQNYVGIIPTDLDGSYAVIYTNSDRAYYIWFALDGSTIDPGIGNSVLDGYIGIKIDMSTLTVPDTKSSLTALMKTQIDIQDVFDDFDTIDNGGDLDLITESFDSAGITSVDTIALGYEYSIETQADLDPDPSDRFPIRVNISRNILSTTDVADATAAAILENDSAGDFNVTYSGGDNILIETNQNGNVDDTTDVLDSRVGSSVTFGSPTVITSVGHGMRTGDQVVISNSTTTPTIDGTRLITYIDDNSFSITDITTASGTCDYEFYGIGYSFNATVTQQGDGEDPGLNHILLSSAPSPSQQIDETARSIVNIINRNETSSVNAFYISGSTDVPGQMLLESRDVSTSSYYLNASSVVVGKSFNPVLPVSGESVKGESETKPNRLAFSKTQQPEAVPLLNFIDIGPQDKAISRILALRESLFILKEDGVYRLTGFDGNFTVDLFDESTKILAPDTAVVLNNQIFCLANNGIVTISDTGVEIISGRLDNLVQGASTSSDIVKTASFGVSYETDRSYLLFAPRLANDTSATQAIRYRTDNDTWTRYTISKTCGIVMSSDDKLYLGPSDENFIEQERKDFSRTDYADRKYTLNIPSDSVNDNEVLLSQPNIAEAGDAVLQTQYLTLAKFNQLLKTLDLDNSVDNDYFDLLAGIPGDNIKDKVDSLGVKLDSDPNPADNDYFASVQEYSDTGASIAIGDPTVITSVGHNLQTGRLITISNSTSTPNLDGNHIITKITDDTFSIEAVTTSSGFCDWAANMDNFEEVQAGYNTIVNKLNLDANILRTNYPLSIGTIEFEDIVNKATTNRNNIELQYSLPLLEGPIDIYKRILCEIVYAPETFGDVSVSKHVREATVMFENNNFTRATVGYKTDLSPGIEEINFDKSGKGDWGQFLWSQQNWGGGFASVPLRTYIPRQKQRCRFIQTQFKHDSAREQWAVTGISYTFRGVSERAYRS